MKLYTLDKLSNYYEGLEIRYKVLINQDEKLNDYSVKLYNNNFSSFGDNLFLPLFKQNPHTNQVVEINTVAIMESLFELYRQAHFTDKPSRFQSYFACDNIEKVKEFAKIYAKNDIKKLNIFEIEIYENAIISKHDMNLITQCGKPQGNLISYMNNAHKYWSGEKSSEKPFWEYLIKPPFKIGKLVYSI